MKRKKFLLVAFLLIGAMCLLTGCDKKVEETEKTVSEMAVLKFNELANNDDDLSKITEDLKDYLADEIEFNLLTLKLSSKDEIEGFKSEIKGYKNAYAIKPLISSQPFIAYIFETDKTEELQKLLEDNADLNWNICTQADEFKSSVNDNYVFFVMAKKDYNEED